ncbi:MAG: EAL domain-containing protein, partial [Cyanobacteria bacterium J06650_10]
WVLRRACQQKKDWEENSLADLHLTNFKLAVNLSVRQIEAPGLVDMVQRILDDTQLSPYDLELEVTESLFISEIDHTASVLEALHQKGIRLALDDFGTGYASLNYLRQFPFDILKIDRSFVQDIVHSPDAAEVTRAIVALAKGLSLDLIAEGIETEEQLNRMKAYDCHEIQGYYFSHPLTADKFSQWMEQYR